MPLPTISPGSSAVISTNTMDSQIYKFGGNSLSQLKGGNDYHNALQAWNSAAYDTDRDLFIYAAAGGHGDSPDNAVYVFNVASTQAWSMTKGPTHNTIGGPSDIIPPIVPGGPQLADFYTDTTGAYLQGAGAVFPCSRHTYHGHTYMQGLGKLLLVGGSRWTGGGDHTPLIWELTTPPGSQVWTKQVETSTDQNSGYWSVWDRFRQRLIFADHATLWAYNPAAASGSRKTQINSPSDSMNETGSDYNCACYDTLRHRVVVAGRSGGIGNVHDPDPPDANRAGVSYYDMAKFSDGALVRQQLVFNGASVLPIFGAATLIYDPRQDRYIYYLGGLTYYCINPETGAVTTETLTGSNPGATVTPGVGVLLFDKAQYSPNLDLIIVHQTVTGSVYGMRMPRSSPISVPVLTAVRQAWPTNHAVAPNTPAAKHVQITENPLTGELVRVGGDWPNDFGEDSYANQVHGVDLLTYVGNANPNAGWRRLHGVCPQDGTEVMPKRMDYAANAWNGRVGLFMSWSALYPANGTTLCPGGGETPDDFIPTPPPPGAGHYQNKDDAQFKHYRLFSLDPSTGRWTDRGTNMGYSDSGSPFVSRGPKGGESWHTPYDRVRNQMIRLTEAIDGALAQIYTITSDTTLAGTWASFYMDPLVQQIRVNRPQVGADWIDRVIYFPNHHNNFLYRFNIDARTVTALLPFPDQFPDRYPAGEHYCLSWDIVNRVLLYFAESGPIFAYHPTTPLAGHFWEPVPVTLSPPAFNTLFVRQVGYSLKYNLHWCPGNANEDSTALTNYVFRYSGTFVAPPSDVTSPTVTIDFPANGATVSGTLTIQATANDNVGGSGVRGVLFRRDISVNLGVEDTTVPYSQVWNSTTVSEGTHTLHALATDNAGNTGQAVITVTVDNIPAPSLSSLVPPSGLAGSSLAINGSGFQAAQGGGAVFFGSSTATVSSWSSNQITIVVPSVAVGDYPVSVVTTGGTSNVLTYTIISPPVGAAGGAIFITRYRGWS